MKPRFKRTSMHRCLATVLLLAAVMAFACPIAASASPYLDETYVAVGGEAWSRIPTSACGGSTGQGMCVVPTSEGDFIARSYLVTDAEPTIILYNSDGAEVCRISDGRFGHANSLSWNPSAGVLYVVPSGVTRDPIALISIDVYKKEKEKKPEENADAQPEGEGDQGEGEEKKEEEKKPEYEWFMSIGDITYADESFEWPMNVSYSNGHIYGIETNSDGVLTVYWADVGSDGFVYTGSMGSGPVTDPSGIGLDEFMDAFAVGQGSTVDPSGRYIMTVRFSYSLDSSFPRELDGLLLQGMCVVDLQTLALVSTCGLDCTREIEELGYTSGGSLLAGMNNWTGGIQVVTSPDTGVYGMQTPVLYRDWTVDVRMHDAIPELTAGNPLYSLAGASVDLCTDNACGNAIGTVATGQDGYAGTIPVGNAGRYWLKERVAPHGYVASADALVIDCSPWREDAWIGIDMEKIPAYVQPVSLVSDHSDDLYGLVGSFIPGDRSYRHRYQTALSGYVDEPSATAAATFSASGNGAVPFSVGESVDGSWPYSVNGKNVVPLGTMTIEREPTLADRVSPIADKTYVVHVMQDGNGGQAVARTSLIDR